MSFAGIIRESLLPFTGSTRSVLIEILINCNHSDNPNFLFNNIKLPLKRGDWVASQARLSELTGLERQQIRHAQFRLQKLAILTTKSVTKRGTIYTIVNVDKFLINEKDQPSDKPSDQPNTNQIPTTNNKEDKDNKDISKIQLWNDLVQIKLSTGKVAMTENRRKKLSKFKTSEEWKSFCQQVANSDFLIGNNEKQWKVSIDWVLKPENMMKIKEGNYTNKHKSISGGDRRTLHLEDC